MFFMSVGSLLKMLMLWPSEFARYKSVLFTTNIRREYMYWDWSGKILKFLNNCVQESLSCDPLIILNSFLKSIDMNAVWGISPENYCISNERMNVGIVYQSQFIF